MSDNQSGPAISATPAIRVGTNAMTRATRTTQWQLMLVWFMRVVALLWMAEGLWHWHGILVPEKSVLETLPLAEAAAIVVFAVLDLLTAVGLWLVAPWGGILWICAVAAQMAAIVVMPPLFPQGRTVLALDCVLVVAYFVITYQAGIEGARRGD